MFVIKYLKIQPINAWITTTKQAYLDMYYVEVVIPKIVGNISNKINIILIYNPLNVYLYSI